jgi:hypothetical protein
MYHYSIAGLGTALALVSAGIGGFVATGALVAICLALAPLGGAKGGARLPQSGRAWLPLGFVSAAILVQFALAAGGKKGEYARFAMVPDIALLIFTISILARVMRHAEFVAIPLALLIICGGGVSYLRGYLRDAGAKATDSRRVEALELSRALDAKLRAYDRLRREGKPVRDRPVLGVFNDPAPYCLPPVDLTYWDIVRLPRGFDAIRGGIADVIVYPRESAYGGDGDPTPISWADKKFETVINSVDESAP